MTEKPDLESLAGGAGESQSTAIVPAASSSTYIRRNAAGKDGKSIPTCTVCEKVLIEEMRNKYRLFDQLYGLGHAFIRAWLWVGLSKEEMAGEENNAVRKCRTCEKVYYRQLRERSPRFNRFYKLMDATLEGWIAKFLTEQDREHAFSRDPAHARALVQFNPRNYYMGEDFIIGVKFDGCIATEADDGFPDKIGGPIDGVKEILRDLRQRGAKIVLYGWRSNEFTKGNPYYRKKAEKWMKQHDMPYDFFYDGKGPLIADAFVSRRNLGGSLTAAYPSILEMLTCPEKSYLKRRHIVQLP